MKKFISLLIILTIFVPCTQLAHCANDNEIMALLSELNIMKGDPDGNLRLYDNVTRAEFSKIAVASSLFWKNVGEGLSISPFKDVRSDHWAASYIFTGVSLKLFKGFPDGSFNPDGTILYEEALTILLRVLGYNDADFGYSWPYGQIGLAKNLEITDNVSKSMGDTLTRQDVASLVYNCLDTKYKNEIFKLITAFDCQIIEDVTIYATNKQDTSVGSDKVATSSGIFKFKSTFNYDNVGKKGNLVIKNGDYLTFFPAPQDISEYTVTGTIGGDLVLDGNVFDLDDNFVIINKSRPAVYTGIIPLAKEGDKFFLYRNENGVLDYGRIEAYTNNIELKDLERHIVYSQLNDMAITYCNGIPSQIELKSDMDIYIDNMRSSILGLKSQMETGDLIYVKYDNNGKIDYISFEKGNIDGPITISPANKPSYDTATIIRNGIVNSELQTNDILYFSKDLNLALAYSNTKTGVYENAYPNKDMPNSVVISGVTYQLESSAAFNKLSSTGNFSYGDTVRILLGKSNQIADVVSMSDSTSTAVYGYLIETGEKSYTLSDTNSRMGFYAKLVLPTGETNEYITEKNYSDIKNSVVKLTFTNSAAKADRVSGTSVSGRFDWQSKKLGSSDISKDVKIIDIITTDRHESGGFAKIYPQRLDSLNISASSILYSEKNAGGEVVSLILNNLTGDGYTYGLITSADRERGKYSFNIGKDTKSIAVPLTALGASVTYNVTAGQAARFRFSPIGAVELMQSIEKVPEAITNVTETSLRAGNNTYLLSDKVVVYNKNFDSEYNMIPLSEIIGSSSKYKLLAYYDKATSLGGRIRVIIAEEITK